MTAEQSNVPPSSPAGEALVQQIAEALRSSPNGPHLWLPGPTDLAPSFARAVLPLVEAQVAPLRDEVERWRLAVASVVVDECTQHRRADAAESALRDHGLANGGCVPKPAYDDLAEAHRAAESALRQVREDLTALADRWASESSKMAVGLVKQGCAVEVRELLKSPPVEAECEAHGWECANTHETSARVGAADTQPEGAGEAAALAYLDRLRGMDPGPELLRSITRVEQEVRSRATPTAGSNGDTAPEADGEFCPPSKRADGKHSWRFDGDDPYVVCHFCDEMRDAQSGRVVRPADTAPENGEGR